MILSGIHKVFKDWIPDNTFGHDRLSNRGMISLMAFCSILFFMVMQKCNNIIIASITAY